MVDWLAYLVIGVALACAVWGVVTAVADKAPGNAQIYAAAALELVVLAQSVTGIVRLVLGPRPDEVATTVGYLVGIILLVPIAVFWALSERNRFSGLVMSVAAVAVAAMTLRLFTLWSTAGA
ncbi:hypothetical protein GCM10009841_33740 [Microlunatus panaciterrae]|uniref:Integral membrane protein n=1 Tax=Microlunatus panaciterrae TaxID=400768 RepID=A0ABS2RH86_9ACTN|nr:hypothetical protein [Microlunatus panaciterrae]MBM7798033.1 hypothetical protein [Microlunatus panaciterrae]